MQLDVPPGVAVYAFTFGAYMANAVGGPAWMPQANLHSRSLPKETVEKSMPTSPPTTAVAGWRAKCSRIAFIQPGARLLADTEALGSFEEGKLLEDMAKSGCDALGLRSADTEAIRSSPLTARKGRK